MNAGHWLRAARAQRRISQRELADIAGVPRSTIGRIEAGSVAPRWDTVVDLLAALGWGIDVRDRLGRQLPVRRTPVGHIDEGERRFPAHLEAGPTPGYYATTGGTWWGWGRVAWDERNPKVPANTYWRRQPLWQLTGHPDDRYKLCVWDDAT